MEFAARRARPIVTPLRRLTETAETNVGERHLDLRAPEAGSDATARLASACKQRLQQALASEERESPADREAERHWFGCTDTAVLDEDGEVVAIFGVGDIDARKEAEEALFEAKERAPVTLHPIGDAERLSSDRIDRQVSGITG
ncbi:MAG TPA: hypothetical protein PLC86_20600 [Candidatus Accumulibacter phosphatis]|nr:hypothetical protein [Accumulibacter sp.]HRL78084.1 hypothetical protein [Candidatus Accumulibacter phosphatis]